MNINFKHIDITNFRSIEHISLDLNRQGVVIVKGVNEYEDNATSNGSGKSSVFEAIIFALFEETSSGDKDVANRLINQGYEIQLQFAIDDIDYIIIRKLQNNKTTVQLIKQNEDISCRNKTDTNKQIINLFGITKDIFLDSVFLSQNVSTNISTLSPTSRKERLELLTNTNTVIDNFKEDLKQKQINYETQRVDLELQQNKLKGNKEALNTQLLQLQSKLSDIEEKIKQRELLGNIDEINIQIQEANQQLELQNNSLYDINNQLDNCVKDITSFVQSSKDDNEAKTLILTTINTLKSNISDKSNQINLYNYQIEQCDKNIDRYNMEIQKIKNSDTCPTCGRKYENVNEDHIRNTIKEYEDNIQQEKDKQVNIEKDIKTIQLDITALQSDINIQQEQLSMVQSKLDVYNNELNIKENNKNTISCNKQSITTNINNLNNTIQTLQLKKEHILSFEVGNKQEVLDMMQNVESQLKDIDIKCSTITKDLIKTESYIEVIKHSLQLITKDFRTYLLTNSIDYLNNMLEMFSKDLFSNSKDVICISQEDNKLSIYLGDATYESLSGGEKTRVDIALLLAQKSLANVIGNINCNIIVLDEVLKFCDSETEINIVDLLIKELDTLESIYMISHKEIPIGYDKQLVITKNKNGLSNISSY